MIRLGSLLAVDPSTLWAGGGVVGFVSVCGAIVRGLLQDNRKITREALNVNEQAAKLAEAASQAARQAADARIADLERYHRQTLDDRDRERADLERRLAALAESRDYWQAKALGENPPPPDHHDQERHDG